MGKNYYCDYCDKRMKSNLQIRKKHIEGMPHKKAMNEHYAKFKNAKEILKDESRKIRCMKFFTKNECNFGSFCRFSHYTADQLNELREIVMRQDFVNLQEFQQKTFNDKVFEYMHQQQQKYNKVDLNSCNQHFDQTNINNLPPSLSGINYHLIPVKLTEWSDKPINEFK